MKKIAIFGGSGLVGQQVIDTLSSSGFEITSYQRTKTPTNYGEHQEIIDFDQINNYQFNGDVAIICLGTTIAKAGSKEAFISIDHDLVVKIATWAKQQKVKELHVISSVGASEKARGLYLQTKWRMEQSLQKLHFPTLYIYRPSLYADIDRKPIRIKELTSIPFLNLLGVMLDKFINFRPIKTRTLVKKITSNILQDVSGVYIFESKDIQESASLSFNEYKKKEQSLLCVMFFTLSLVWGILELLKFGDKNIRIFAPLVLFSLLFLWVKSKITLHKGTTSPTTSQEYRHNLKKLHLSRLLVWLELLSLMTCLIFHAIPFLILILVMLFINVPIYYSIRDYLNGLDTNKSDFICKV